MKTIRSRKKNEPASDRGRGRPREFDRKQGLVQAMRVFWSLGYEATSMADLRNALRIKQASLYAAYGSKEELFREAVALYQQTDGITTSRALAANLSAREAIYTMLQDAVDVFTQPGAPGGCLVVLGTINCTVQNKGVQDHLSSLRRQTLKGIGDRLRRGQREGDVPNDAPVVDLAAFYATVLHGLSIQARDGASRKSLTHVVSCAMAAWDQLMGERLGDNYRSSDK